MTTATIEMRMLGPLEVRVDGVPVPLGGRTQRALVALLLLNANDVVPLDVLIDESWDGKPPQTAPAYVQNCVSKLRKVIGKETVETRAPGYRLRVDPDSIDARRFERLVREARPLPARERAAALRDALELWRGTPLSDLAYSNFAQDAIRNLEEQRVNAQQMRLEAELELGQHREAIGELDGLVREHPTHERLRWLQMIALHRSDRRQDALAAYQEARLAIVEESGLEPGEELRALHRRILQDDPTLMTGAAPTEVIERPRQLARKVVAVCIAELHVDESLDVEAARGVVSRALASFEEIAARHGGRVDQLFGEEAVAVFGLPAAHEDDGLRAIRAVSELRDAVTGAELRAAVAVGEALVGEGASLSGAAITVARRAKEAAKPGEILLGPAVARLALDAVRVQPSAEGSWVRLVELVAGAATPARRPDAPLVGREAELERLVLTTREAGSSSTCRRVVVIGEPGIGKTRLAAELVRAIADEARVLTGRCVPYGDGATYLPLAGVVDEVVGDAEPGAALEAVLADVTEGEQAAGRLVQAISGSTAVTSGDVFWATRTLLETLARAEPLVVVLEDVHWAEPTFLDLVEYVVGWSKRAPITLVCLARTELLDERPSWVDDALVLRPLPADAASVLLDALPESSALDAGGRASVVSVADGNPLFLEQLAAHAVEAPLDAGEVPPSLDSLLASRLDALRPGEKRVLERAAVVGREFTRAAVDALTSEERGSTATELMALVRRRLVRPDDRETGEDAFLFEHALVRDAAYASITKNDRANLHERLARWLDERGELDEIVGQHLERAVENRRATGEEATELAAEAGARLAIAGERAAWGMDHPAAARLLERARGLLAEGDARRLRAECVLGFTLKSTGEWQKAIGLLGETVERARAAGDRKHELWGAVERLWPQTLEGTASYDDMAAVGAEVEALALADRDPLVVARARDAVSTIHGREGRFADWHASLSLASDAYEEYGLRGFKDPTLVQSLLEGPLPLPEVIALCEARLAAVDAPRWRHGYLLATLADAEAHRGEFLRARGLLEASRSSLLELDQGFSLDTVWSFAAGSVALMEGDAASASDVVSPALEKARKRGDLIWQVFLEALASEAATVDGAVDSALRLAAEARSTAPNVADLWMSYAWRFALASAQLANAELADAEAEVRSEIERWRNTDAVIVKARLELLLAEALAAAGRQPEAVEHAAESLRLLEEKGATYLAERARKLVAGLAEGGAQR